MTDGPYGETKELFGGFWMLEHVPWGRRRWSRGEADPEGILVREHWRGWSERQGHGEFAPYWYEVLRTRSNAGYRSAAS